MHGFGPRQSTCTWRRITPQRWIRCKLSTLLLWSNSTNSDVFPYFLQPHWLILLFKNMYFWLDGDSKMVPGLGVSVRVNREWMCAGDSHKQPLVTLLATNRVRWWMNGWFYSIHLTIHTPSYIGGKDSSRSCNLLCTKDYSTCRTVSDLLMHT